MKLLILLLIFSGCSLNSINEQRYDCEYVQDEYGRWNLVCVELDDGLDEVTE